MANKCNVLIVEDIGDTIRGTVSELDLLGIGHELAGSIRTAEEALGQGRYDLMVVDMRLPNEVGKGIIKEGGINLVEKLRSGELGKDNRRIPFIVVSAQKYSVAVYKLKELGGFCGLYSKLQNKAIIDKISEIIGDLNG